MNYNDEEFTMNQLLKHLLASTNRQERQEACPNCGMTLRESVHIGKFGCSECYEAFSEYVPQIVERVQAGNHEHVGSAPLKSASKINLKRKIEALEVELQQLITEQNFEQAAVIRDEIKVLKESGEPHAK